MLDATEFGSKGLKSRENVTPVVGSAMRTLPPDAEDVVVLDWQAASAIAANPTIARGRHLIDQSPPKILLATRPTLAPCAEGTATLPISKFLTSLSSR